MNKSGMLAALGEDVVNPIFFAEGFDLADELDLQPRLGGYALGVGSALLTQRLGRDRCPETFP